MSRIFWDTNLFIYLLEGSGKEFKLVSDLREAMLSRGDQMFTSTFTLGEVLVKPVETGDDDLYKKYLDTITGWSTLIDFNLRAAAIYASLRTDRFLKPPDAIQLACAASSQVDLFVTNDSRLHSRYVEGIQFIVSLARAPI